jgi:hypothetical protein
MLLIDKNLKYVGFKTEKAILHVHTHARMCVRTHTHKVKKLGMPLYKVWKLLPQEVMILLCGLQHII